MAETTDTRADDGVKIIGASAKAFKGRIARCKTKRRDLLDEWQINLEYRRGKVSETDTDDDRTAVNVDWPMTKAKCAQLFSQVPKVVVTADNKEYKPAAPVFEKRLNMRLQKGGTGATIFEVAPDVVNASGVGAAIVKYEARTEMKDVPAQPLETLGMLDRTLISMGLKAQEMVQQPFVVDRKFSVERISPDDLLWDVDFAGSDFNRSPWIGRDGRMTWAESQTNFVDEDGEPLIPEDMKDTVIGDSRTSQDRLVPDNERDRNHEQDIVSYQEVYYWRYLYHADEKYFLAIQRMVFVEGMDKPIINEPWKGQRFDDELGTYIGACRFPIQVLTLNYMSNEPIPPSDSAIARPATKDKQRSRDQMFQQRDLSKPIRWMDTNRIDADIQTLLMLGDFQGIIPTQGPGDKALGEVARSSYPRENMELDRAIQGDIMEAWSIGPNQMGTLATGERSAREAGITEGHFQTRTGQERARFVEFFLNLADVMAGLICLYDDFELPDLSDEDRERLYMWDKERISHELAFTIRGDSTVLLTAEQRIDRIMRFLDIAGKSNYTAPKALLEELAALSGLDPAEVVVEPPPKGPEPPSVSMRFSGSEDLSNPIAVAMLLETQALTPEKIAAAIKLIQSAGSVATVKLGTESDEVSATVHEPGDEPPPVPPGPQPAGPDGPQPMADDRPDWQTTDRINSRRDASQE